MVVPPAVWCEAPHTACGAVCEIGVYSDVEIAEWDNADELSEAERGEIVKRLGAPKR